jgi:hypothetical protein
MQERGLTYIRNGSMAAVSAVPRPLRNGIRKGHPRGRLGGGIVIALLIFGVSLIIAFVSPQLLSSVFYAPPQIKAVDAEPAVRGADIVFESVLGERCLHRNFDNQTGLMIEPQFRCGTLAKGSPASGGMTHRLDTIRKSFSNR